MAVQPKSGTVLYLVYLRRGSISAESQHPAHKKNQLWAGTYHKFRWESFPHIFDIFWMVGCNFQNEPDQKSDPGNWFVSRSGKKLTNFKSHQLAILKIIWHIWEDGSQKVNMNEPNLRFFHGNFWPVISQAVRKPCFSAWIPRGLNFWKPLTCGYVAAGVFFPGKRAPYFWKPWTCGYVAAGAFFSL